MQEAMNMHVTYNITLHSKEQNKNSYPSMHAIFLHLIVSIDQLYMIKHENDPTRDRGTTYMYM